MLAPENRETGRGCQLSLFFTTLLLLGGRELPCRCNPGRGRCRRSRLGRWGDGHDDRRTPHGDPQTEISRSVRAHANLGSVLPGARCGIQDDLDQSSVRHSTLQPHIGAGEGVARRVLQRHDVVAQLATGVPPGTDLNVHVAKAGACGIALGVSASRAGRGVRADERSGAGVAGSRGRDGTMNRSERARPVGRS